MSCKSIFSFIFFLCFEFCVCNSQQTWIQAGYWTSRSDFPISDINSALFTHLLCTSAFINSSNYHLYINSYKEQYFSTFTDTVKRKNPSILTLLSIWSGRKDPATFSSMINEFDNRKTFIESSISAARLYGFDGLDLGVNPNVTINMTKLGIFLDEWRNASASEARNSGKPQLLLVMSSYYLPAKESISYPIEAMRKNLDWVHIVAFDIYVPTRNKFTGPHAALYGASKWANTDDAIKEWTRRGLPVSKIVLGLPYHGYVWTLVNPNDNDTGAPSSGPAITVNGAMGYKAIKSNIRNYGYGVSALFNSTYAMKYFTLGSSWFNFDDEETIKAKVSYAKQKKLLGYSVFQLGNDDNWVLSRAAHGREEDMPKKKRLLVVVLLPVIVVCFLLSTLLWCYFKRGYFRAKGITVPFRRSLSMRSDGSNLQEYSFSTIKVATDNFSNDNKLGKGGFGPVYKGKLPNGKEIAVKRLSTTSSQGAEEFQNEVTLTERLQHINLLRVLGFCTERQEKMIIYEFMQNQSLDFYLYDQRRKYTLNWIKRIHIIEGVIQGLIYLQEYSNFTVVHRDIKASNILLDEDMNAKIADFGIARLFKKDELEANTGKIVGTFGYAPPEYVRKGIYSTKYDVYSFGVLLLQIIGGKKITCYYGPDENLNLLEYAYNLWEDGEGREFLDQSLDDSSSTCKLLRCLQVALLCVQENPLDRPSMLEVSMLLKNEAAEIATPKRHAFSTIRDEDHELNSFRKNTIHSVNDATITQAAPR